MSETAERAIFGAIEGGGTKFVCLIGRSPEDVVDEIRVPTTTPEETLGEAIRFFARSRPGIRLAALGVATFGPIELNRALPDYGSVLPTAKVGWSGARIVAPLRQRLGVPIEFDTDVNGAILGEARWGAARGADPAIYLTIGTGIGGGALVNGATVHGLMHPEMGHIPVAPVAGDDFPGICPFHGRCLEGMASGPAIEARALRAGAIDRAAGQTAKDLPADHPIWELTATYLGQGIATLVLVLSPQRIVIGGGVMDQAHLLPRVRAAITRALGGYVQRDAVAARIDDYVVAPELGARAGVLGALVLAEGASEAARAGAARGRDVTSGQVK